MRIIEGGRDNLRRLVDKLSPQLEVGQRMNNPATGIDYVEAISYEAYRAIETECLDAIIAKRDERVEKARTKYLARKEAKNKAEQQAEINGPRRIDLNL